MGEEAKKWRDQFQKTLRRIGLSAEEATVVACRLGDPDGNGLADRLKVSRQRVSQIWAEGIHKLEDAGEKLKGADVPADAKRCLADSMVRLAEIREEITSVGSAIFMASERLGAPVAPFDLDAEIDERVIPARVFNRLDQLGVKKLRDFRKVSRNQIRELPGCGVETVEQLERSLAVYGVFLKG